MFGEITTGASNDIEQATKLARGMITRYGMSKDFDMVALETVTNQYLGGDASLACSADTQRKIDEKVVEIIRTQHAKAIDLLERTGTSWTSWPSTCARRRPSPARSLWRFWKERKNCNE